MSTTATHSYARRTIARRAVVALIGLVAAAGIAGPLAGTASAIPKDPGGITSQPPVAPPTVPPTVPPVTIPPGLGGTVGPMPVSADPGTGDPAPQPPATQPPATGTPSGNGNGTSGARSGSASSASSPSTAAGVGVPDPTVVTPAETAADAAPSSGGGAGTVLLAGAALAVVGALTVGGITLARRRNA